MNWREFHDFTKHDPRRYGGESDDPHRPVPMDPNRRPNPFKGYSGKTESTRLVDGRKEWFEGREPGNEFEQLSRLLLVGAGAKKFKSGPAAGRYFRTYASAGALHPNEIYVATSDLEGGLPAGLYHFAPRNKSLTRLGEGDPRVALSRATGQPMSRYVLIVTGIPWRTSWKYGPRGYRHLWWDAGMIIANFTALSERPATSMRVMGDFDDEQINSLVGIDGVTEMTLALITVGEEESTTATTYRPYKIAALPLGPRPHEFVEITQVHRSTSVRASCVSSPEGIEPRALPGNDPADRVIWRRGSTRRFDRSKSMTRDALHAILGYASTGFSTDWNARPPELFAVAHGVRGLEPGVYRWDAGDLVPVRPDPESREAGYYLSLGQDLGFDAAALVFPMADLAESTERCGPRGYRLAQLSGAIQSGRVYLASYAQGVGATGLTFFDDEVSRYLQSNGEPMLEVAMGLKAERQFFAARN